MILKCTECAQALKLADEQISPDGTRVLCPRCKTVFVARRDGTASPVEPAPPAPPPPSPAPPTAGGLQGGRPAQVSDDDDGDFDLISQLEIGGGSSDEPPPAPKPEPPAPAPAPPTPAPAPPTPEPEAPADDDAFDFDLDDGLGEPEPPPSPASPSAPDTSGDDLFDLGGDDPFALGGTEEPPSLDAGAGEADEASETFDLDVEDDGSSETFELGGDDGGSETFDIGGDDDPFSLDISEPPTPAPTAPPRASTSGDETAFDLPPLEPQGEERERSLGDIFSEDDESGGEPLGGGELGDLSDLSDLSDLPPLKSGGGVSPGGEIDGTLPTGPPSGPALPPAGEADAPMRMPPPRAPGATLDSERRGIPGWLIGLLLVLVAVGAAGAFLATREGGVTGFVGAIREELHNMTTDSGPPAPTLPELAIEGTSGAREPTGDRVVYTLRGRVRNASSIPAYVISLSAELLDADGRVIGRAESFAGNTIAADALAELPLAEVHARLRREIGEGGDNVRVEAGSSLPFLLVFDQVPGSSEPTFRIEATSRLPDVPPGESTDG